MYEVFAYEQYSSVILLATFVLMLLIFLPAVFPKFRNILNKLLKHIVKKPNIADESIYELIDKLGYEYDAAKDIFYSGLNAWQRDVGYCKLYDEAAAPMSMIIDCEPIYFEYDNRRWLIEFWKGQYGMTTGCEIGVYSTAGSDVQTEYFNGTFYECARDEDLLSMSFVLKKKGKKLFSRKDIHWWLTGFKLGEFSEPKELVAELKITLKDLNMLNEFVNGLKSAGYEDEDIVVINNSVMVVFDQPKTLQPYTRNELTDYVMQLNNRELCEHFNVITKDYTNSMDKIMYLKESAPELFEEFFNLGRNKDVFNAYWDIIKYKME